MNHHSTRRGFLAAVMLSSAALLWGCSGNSAATNTPSSTPEAETAAPSEAAASSTPDECADYASYGSFPGTSVEFYTGIVAPQDATHMASYDKFERCTGITVDFQGDQAIDTQIHVRIQGGDPPDLALFAQPGVIKQLVDAGSVVKAPDAVVKNVTTFWSEAWQKYVTFDGTVYGAPLNANVKSLVWYSPKEFADNGYQIPKTLDELKALSEQIAASGKKPWCAGIASGEATGWAVTDWMEELMLRLSGPDAYDQWVAHEIPFNGPAAVAALDAAGEYLKNPAFVNGGFGDVTSIASTAFQDAGLPILQGQCSLMRQGSFYSEMWPKGTTVAEDGDVFAFYFPSADGVARPILGGGAFVVAFSDRPEVQAFQAFLSSDTWANEKVAVTPEGGDVTANNGLDVSKLVSPIDKLSAEILLDPEAVFRFDGSDLMPSAVGTTAFWTQSTNWITGQSTQDTLDAIEGAWPAR